MKKMMTLLLCMMLVMCGIAFAENTAVSDAEVQTLPLGEIVLIEDGMLIDLDIDGNADVIELKIITDESGYDCGYSLTVNGQEAAGEGWDMDTNLYALKLNEYQGTLLMVSDYGPSDDYATHFYLYEMDYNIESGVLTYAGTIYSLPELMQVNDEMITASVRANLLCTWYRETDFAFARSMAYEEPLSISVYEIPRYLYPMSIIATLNVDLPLIDRMNGNEYSTVLFAGEAVILCATDDEEWVLIQALESGKRGWMQVTGEYGFDCIVGDELISSDAVFYGLPFAD